MTLEPTIRQLKERMAKAQRASVLASHSVALMAVSKTQGPEAIEQAIAAGVSRFGENRVQEAHEKWPAIKKRYPHVKLHLIGPLQTNKVKDALALFDVIETLDRPKLADAIAEARGQGSGIRDQQFFIQVNTGEELQKAGIFPKEADAFIEHCIKKYSLPIVGLMCVPPADQPPAPHFALLREIANRHGLKELSMGMSGDFETAICMGATSVRIGTALFGERK